MARYPRISKRIEAKNKRHNRITRKCLGCDDDTSPKFAVVIETDWMRGNDEVIKPVCCICALRPAIELLNLPVAGEYAQGPNT